MQAIRGTRLFTRITRCVALWFALALTAASASPLIQPKALEVICSASGVFKLVVQGEDPGSLGHDAHRTVDCALCLPTSAPPPAADLEVAKGVDEAVFVAPKISPPPERRHSLAPPPRGPPLLQIS